MKASVFIGTSVDGFIARANGDLDFLPPGGGEPHGYDEFMSTVDALVIGRNTFETVLTFDSWPYGEKPVFVLSTRLLPFPARRGGGADVRRSGRRRLAACDARSPTYLRGWWDYDSAVSSGWAHSAAHYYSRPGADRYGDPALWPIAKRCRPQARRDPSYRQRPCPERVCGLPLTARPDAPARRTRGAPLVMPKR